MTGRSCCRLQGLKRWLRRFAPFCIGDYPLARSRELAIERISNRFAIGLAAVLLLNFTACQSLIRSCCRLQDIKRCFERISNRFAIGLAAVLLLNFTACQSLKRAAAPVVIYDAKVSERDCLGVEFVAVNLCGRPVKSAAFRISVSEKKDEDGEDGGDFCGVFFETLWTLDGGLDAGEERTVFIPLEDAPPDCEADGLEIESVLVESAVFEDGGGWRRKN